MDIYIPGILMEISQLWPIIVLFMAIGMILLTDLMLEVRVARTLRNIIVSFCLLAVILTSFNFMNDPNVDFMNSGLLAGAMVFDRVFLFQCIFLSLLLLAIIVISESLSPTEKKRSVFLCLMLASLAGTILIGSTRHLLFLALAIELSSMPIYALVARPSDITLDNHDSGLRYLFTGMFCSAIMVFGISLLYALSGSFEFQKIALRISVGGIKTPEMFALVCLIAGIGFKLMLVPLAWRNVNVVAVNKVDVGVWLTLAGTFAGLIAFARLLQILTWFADDSFNTAMVKVLAIAIGVSILIASIAAFRSSSVKRLLAWASIVHIASMAIGVLVWSSRSGLASVLVYLITFALTTLGTFAIVGLVERSRGTDRLESFGGLSYRNPILAAGMLILLLSLIGVPPLAGFTAKWNLLTVLWEQGFRWSAAGVLLAGILSVFYYLRIVRVMYSKSTETRVVAVPSGAGIVLFVCVVGVFALFLGRNLLMGLSYSLLTGFWG
jgi:NADH-quinone oxidoreductase subunit N